MSETDEERELPDGWQWVPFGEIVEHRLGKMLDKRKNEGTPRPYLRNVNVRWHGFDLDDLKEMRIGDDEVEKYTVRRGDLVICEGGEPGRAAIWNREEPIAYQKALHRARPRERVEAKYLLYTLEDAAESGRLANHFTGSTINHLTGRALAEVPVPLAPPEEQRRIVDKIEELFSDLDAGVQALETARRQLDRYRQSVLKAAVQGDLTAAWRAQHGTDAEPADALLDRILEERRARWEADYAAKYEAKGKTPPKGWKDRYKEPQPPDTADLSDLPDGWVWSSFDAMLSEGLRNGKSAKTAEKGVRVLTLSAVTDGDFSKANTKIADLEEATVEDLWLTEGDLLIERSNTPELVGTTRLYKGPDNFAVFPDLVIRARTSSLVIDRYAEIALQSHAARTYFMSKARGTSGSMQKINQSTIQGLPFPLAPLAEQVAIVGEVEQRLSVVDAVTAEVEAQLARADRLRRAILKHAFEGKLVPQESTASLTADTNGSSAPGEQLTLNV